MLTALGGLTDFPIEAEAGEDYEDLESTKSHQELSAVSRSEIPPYPDDPFIQPAFGIQYILGWENHGYANVSTEKVQQTVLGLHPDVLAFDQLLKYKDGQLNFSFPGGNYQSQFDLAKALGLPATSGMNVHIDLDEEEASSRYGQIMEESEWAFPDGTPVTSPLQIIGETFDGKPHQTSFEFETLGTPSVFAPGGLELMTKASITQLEKGYSAFFVDGVGVFRLHGLDFSRWARAAFQTHLESLSEDRLSSLGIETPESFDIREYLQSNSLTPDSNTDPRGDPVFREYLIHQHQGINRWFEAYRETIIERFPQRMENGEIALYANQFTGNFNNPQAANIYISDSLDAIYTELFPRVDPPVELNYKIMRSVGNFSKPVIAKGTLGAVSQDKLNGLDAGSSTTMFQRFQVAEAYATGARFQLPLTNRMGYSEDDSITNWVAGDGSVPDELSSFVDFLWAHERFLSDLEPAGDIALIWSLPTRVWRHEPTWEIGSYGTTPKIDSFTGTASILREGGFTYDVLTFGHPRLWDDSIQLDRLDDYEMVILAGVESISDEQVSELRAHLENGGTLLCTDSMPDHDAMYEPREDIGTIFNHDNATVLDGFPGRHREEEGEADGTLLDALETSEIESTRQTDDSDIAVHSHRQSEPNRHVISLVNYAYNPATDSFSRKSDINVRIPTISSADPTVRYYRPQSQKTLEVQQIDGSQEVVVPELVEWGIIVVAEDEADHFRGDSDIAHSSIEEAMRKMDDIREIQNTGNKVLVAETKLSAAKTALEYDSFAKAQQNAKEVIETVDPLLSTDDQTTESAQDDDSQGDYTAGPDSQDQKDEQTELTAGNDGPGFNVGGALAGIVGAAYVLKHRLTNND